jgi:hypothetical protein
MARLVNLGVGDIVDRLTILSLKLLYGEQAGKETKHFRDERNALLTQIHARDQYQLWYEQGLELHAVNAALWQAEDEMRGFREHELGTASGRILADGWLREVTDCAFQIQKLNDRRSELIAQINAKVGDPAGSEKI